MGKVSKVSPSTRRAWIEIKNLGEWQESDSVALHPEGVDRNHYGRVRNTDDYGSPSTRRAWIEITSSSPPKE